MLLILSLLTYECILIQLSGKALCKITNGLNSRHCLPVSVRCRLQTSRTLKKAPLIFTKFRESTQSRCLGMNRCWQGMSTKCFVLTSSSSLVMIDTRKVSLMPMQLVELLFECGCIIIASAYCY